MSLVSGIAVYFVIWWACLFMVLPWGVRNPHEADVTVEEGHEPGAPVNPMMWRKLLFTTIIATAIFAVVYGQVVFGWISFEDIPFLGGMPER